MAYPSLAGAQTWADQRTTPALRELVSIDQTGEPNWLFGAEDVAEDGLNIFQPAEQSADVRSAYVTTDRRRLWLRVYVSNREAPTELTVFAFVDTDRDPATGGSPRAPALDAALATGPAVGGYELVFELGTDETLVNVFRFSEANDVFEPIVDLEPLELVSETGTDLDPLRLVAPSNGYVQVALDLGPLEVGVACEVNFLFRSSAGMGIADRDVGVAGPCVPGDANDNGVSDVAETDAACTEDEQCPADGLCRDGRCQAPEFVVASDEVVQGGAFSCGLFAGRGAGSSAALFFGLVVGVALRRTVGRKISRGRAGS